MKQNFATEAKNLYSSPLFIKSKQYAENRLDKYFILSAKYGLLEPDEVIEPYEETLNTKSKKERIEWANKVFQNLNLRLQKHDKIVFLAGEKYREFLEEKLKETNVLFQTPLNKYSIGKQLQWYKHYSIYSERIQHLDRLYSLVSRLKKGLKVFPKLNEIDGSKILPKRGLYLFFEDNEFRMSSPFVERIVRVGTHAISQGSSSTLWNRLRTHRGGVNLKGNHRSSIFRLHVGNSFIKSNKINLPSWGIDQNASKETKKEEVELEKLVSEYIGSMKVLWLNINDKPTKFSDRSYIEKNLIALLSTYRFKIDNSSIQWLGNINQNKFIRDSSLWNVNYVDLRYDSNFLNIFEQYVDITISKKDCSEESLVPIEWHNLSKNDPQLNLFEYE